MQVWTVNIMELESLMISLMFLGLPAHMWNLKLTFRQLYLRQSAGVLLCIVVSMQVISSSEEQVEILRVKELHIDLKQNLIFKSYTTNLHIIKFSIADIIW